LSRIEPLPIYHSAERRPVLEPDLKKAKGERGEPFGAQQQTSKWLVDGSIGSFVTPKN
jgi:hypothetical protein